MDVPKGNYVELATPRGMERWRLCFRRQSDWAVASADKRTIFLRTGQSPTELADTLAHEAIHIATGIGFDLRADDPIEIGISRSAANAVAMQLKLGLLKGDDD